MTNTDLRPRGSPRMKRKTLYIAATAICILLYCALMLGAAAQPWLVWPALVIALLSVVFACFWVASLDEAARQAHYIAWYWGGSTGLAVSMLAFVTVMLRPEPFDDLFAAMHAHAVFSAGVMVGLVPAVLGYAIWWVLLWLRRG